MAKKLSDGVAALEGCRLAAPTEINEVFAIIPQAMADKLKTAGAIFADWPKDTAEADVAPGEGETAHATPP
jgi:threonine aldolase